MTDSLTPAQKAGKTNHERAERRKKAWRQEIKEKKLIREEMNSILNNPEASSTDKIQAAIVISKLLEEHC